MDDKWNYWKMLFFEIVDKHAPLVKIRVKRDKADRIDKDLLSLMRTHNYYKGEYKKKKKLDCRSIGAGSYKELRADVNRRMRQAKANHFSALKVQPSQSWKQLNSLLGRTNSRPVNSLRSGDGVLTKKVEIVNKMDNHFSNIPLLSTAAPPPCKLPLAQPPSSSLA